MFGKTSETLIRTEQPIVVGRFGALMAPRYVRMPTKRAEHLVTVGHAVHVNESDVPPGEKVIGYSEKDFEAPHTAKQAPKVVFELADLLHKFEWSEVEWRAAICCGFPEPDQTIFKQEPGSGAAVRVPRWSATPVENWRAKILALKIN